MTHTTTLVPEPGVRPGEVGEEIELHGVLAEFENPGDLLVAAKTVRDAGYTRWDCHTPFPVHGLDRAMGMKMTKLPVFVFFCGLTGALVGTFLQWFTNASSLLLYLPMSVEGYPWVIAGKPIWSLPANIPVIFEMTILFSAFGAVFGMFGLNRLPKLYNPLFSVKRFARVTDDRFFLYIESEDPRFDLEQTQTLLKGADASAVEIVED